MKTGLQDNRPTHFCFCKKERRRGWTGKSYSQASSCLQKANKRVLMEQECAGDSFTWLPLRWQPLHQSTPSEKHCTRCREECSGDSQPGISAPGHSTPYHWFGPWIVTTIFLFQQQMSQLQILYNEYLTKMGLTRTCLVTWKRAIICHLSEEKRQSQKEELQWHSLDWFRNHMNSQCLSKSDSFLYTLQLIG